MFIEILILKRLKKELKEKQYKIERMCISIDNNKINDKKSYKNKRVEKKIEQNRKSERKAVMMVFVNSVLNIFLRFSEIWYLLYFSDFFYYNYFKKHTKLFIKICGDGKDKFRICEAFIHIVDFFYILSLTTSFLTIYFFNKKFKKNLKIFFKIK